MSGNKYLEEQLNDTLDTDIEWSQLPKDDLKEFSELVESEEFVKKVAGNYASNVTGGEVQEQVENWKPGKVIGMVMSKKGSIRELF